MQLSYNAALVQVYSKVMIIPSVSLYVVVQLLSHVWPFVTPCDPRAPLPSTTSWGLLNLMSIEVGDAICPSHPLLPPSSPAFNLSKHQGLFQWVSSLHSFYGSYFPYSLYEIFFFFYSNICFIVVVWNETSIFFLTQHAPSFLLSFIPEFSWF